MTDRTITNLRRRLEKWELDHLRAMCAQQADRIERLESELALTQQNVDFWYDRTIDLTQDLLDHEKTIGLTRDGQIGVVQPETPKEAA